MARLTIESNGEGCVSFNVNPESIVCVAGTTITIRGKGLTIIVECENSSGAKQIAQDISYFIDDICSGSHRTSKVDYTLFNFTSKVIFE